MRSKRKRRQACHMHRYTLYIIIVLYRWILPNPTPVRLLQWRAVAVVFRLARCNFRRPRCRKETENELVGRRQPRGCIPACSDLRRHRRCRCRSENNTNSGTSSYTRTLQYNIIRVYIHLPTYLLARVPV